MYWRFSRHSVISSSHHKDAASPSWKPFLTLSYGFPRRDKRPPMDPRIKMIGALVRSEKRSSARNDLPRRFAHTHAKGHALPRRCVPTGSRGLMHRVIIKTPFRAHGERWDVRRAIIKPLPRLSRNGLVNGPLCGQSYYIAPCTIRWTNTKEEDTTTSA